MRDRMKGKETFLAKASYLLQKQKTVKDNTICPQKIKFLLSVQHEGLCLFSIALILVFASLRPW